MPWTVVNSGPSFKQFYVPASSALARTMKHEHATEVSAKHGDGYVDADVDRDPLTDVSESQSQASFTPSDLLIVGHRKGWGK